MNITQTSSHNNYHFYSHRRMCHCCWWLANLFHLLRSFPFRLLIACDVRTMDLSVPLDPYSRRAGSPHGKSWRLLQTPGNLIRESWMRWIAPRVSRHRAIDPALGRRMCRRDSCGFFFRFWYKYLSLSMLKVAIISLTHNDQSAALSGLNMDRARRHLSQRCHWCDCSRLAIPVGMWADHRQRSLSSVGLGRESLDELWSSLNSRREGIQLVSDFPICFCVWWMKYLNCFTIVIYIKYFSVF